MYLIQNRHQDSAWEASGRSAASFVAACRLAREMSKDQIVWGMTRVLHPNGGCRTFTCGYDLDENLPDPATGRHRDHAPPRVPPVRDWESASLRARVRYS